MRVKGEGKGFPRPVAREQKGTTYRSWTQELPASV